MSSPTRKPEEIDLMSHWHEVRRRGDLPPIGERVLFEGVSSWRRFRFYGVRVDTGVVRMLLHRKEISWICIARWMPVSNDG